MSWIAPSEKDTATDTLEKRLWDAADQSRANSGLKPQEYSKSKTSTGRATCCCRVCCRGQVNLKEN